tara:strand:+ start:1099 stop:1563 length:465 start_codon:yes stop_codon:yes gene_type:complete
MNPRLNNQPDFYAQREERMVLKYFERKALGDFSVPVPDITMFEHVAAFSQPLFAMACERELRALFLSVGDPLSLEMCASLIENHVIVSDPHPSTVEVSRLITKIDDLDDEITELSRERDELEAELLNLKCNALNEDYVPADALPLARELERQGA